MDTRGNVQYISIEEAASELRISRRAVYNLLRRGCIGGLQKGRISEWIVDKLSFGGLLDEKLSEKRKVAIQEMANRFLLEVSIDSRIKI